MTTPTPASPKFDENSPEYYPSACCEILHVTNAVYLATLLQVIFVITLALFYSLLETNSFINAVEVFRPAVGFVICTNIIGIFCALVGVLMQKDFLVSAQITLLIGLVVVSDLVAFALVATMAFGSKGLQLSTGRATGGLMPSYLLDEKRFEGVLGPFWIYLVAILFHMFAAITMCIIGVYRRYCKFLKDKFSYSRVHSTNHGGGDGGRGVNGGA